MSNWDFLATLLRIYSRYGGSPFFKISVEINPINATKHIIRLKPIEFEMPIYYYTNASLSDPVVIAYMGMLQDILTHLGGLPSDSRRFSENIYGYERRIAHIISNPDSLHRANSRYDTMTVLELTRSAPAVHIEEILKDYFPNTITQNTRVWVPSVTYFRDISGIVSTTDDRILNDYLIASVVRNLLPFMGQNFTLFSNMFKQKLTASNYLAPRWEFCTSVLHRMIPLAVASTLQNDGEIATSQFDARLKTVEEVFSNMKQSLLVDILESNWISKKSKDVLQNMNVHCGVMDENMLQARHNGYSRMIDDWS
ncbi:endothelin converting enzyme 1 [Arctopsyche grandis]|uniref:endothelin converting enzyme 1 n=1 Tax=Arctopsyche grandis TaxID=121162 RepID=UPI00406D8B60